jgi:hypothetical protein
MKNIFDEKHNKGSPGMHRIQILPDIRPANLKAGYRISGAGRIPDIRPDINSTLA